MQLAISSYHLNHLRLSDQSGRRWYCNRDAETTLSYQIGVVVGGTATVTRATRHQSGTGVPRARFYYLVDTSCRF